MTSDVVQLREVMMEFLPTEKANYLLIQAILNGVDIHDALLTMQRLKIPEEKPLDAVSLKLEQNLRTWRKEESIHRGVPAYIIITERVINRIVEKRPTTLDELSRINGIGPKMLEKYGDVLKSLIEDTCKCGCNCGHKAIDNDYLCKLCASYVDSILTQPAMAG